LSAGASPGASASPRSSASRRSARRRSAAFSGCGLSMGPDLLPVCVRRVFDREQDQHAGPEMRTVDAAGIQQQPAPPDARELVLELKVVEAAVVRKDPLEELPQPGVVPRAPVEFEYEATHRAVGRHLKAPEEGAIRAHDAHLGVEDEERVAYRLQQIPLELEGGMAQLGALRACGIHEHDREPLDRVAGG